MGLSIFVTTEDERAEIALQLIPEATEVDGGAIKGNIKDTNSIRERNKEVIYNPKTDDFSIPHTKNSGDLLELFCFLRKIDRIEGGPQFCEEFELDVDLYNQKKELMDFVGYIPDKTNMKIGIFFEKLTRITKKQAKILQELYGWEAKILNKYKITMIQGGEETEIAFPVHNKHGRLIAFRIAKTSNMTKLSHIGSEINSAYTFPEISQLDKDYPMLITINYVDALCALSQDIDAIALIGWKKDKLPDDLLYKFENNDVAIAFPSSKNGMEHAMVLAEALYPIAKSVELVKWPECMGMPDSKGQRLYEYFVKHNGTVETLNTLMVPYKPNEPLPLRRELEPPKDYPIEALPTIIRDAVLDVGNAMQCSPALAAQSFLAVSALAVQAHMSIEMDGRSYPTSCFFVTIAESGERKSSIDKIAMTPVFAREVELRAEQKEKLAEYNRQMAIYEKYKKDALKSANPSAVLKELGQPPERPLDALLTFEEPTYEGVVKKLEHGQPSIGIFSDEGGRFLGGSAMNKDNQQKTATGLSSLWDGRPITRVRVTDSIVLDGKRVSMHLMVQPVIAEQMLASELMLGQGLMSRILVAYPTSTIGTRMYNSINLKESTALQKYNELIGKILSHELPIRVGTTNELETQVMQLNLKAKEKWVEFHNYVEKESSAGGKYHSIRGFALKAAELSLRLACILTCVNDPDNAEEIPVKWIKSAISIVEYHLSEALRLFNVGYDAPEMRLAEECLDWLRRKFPVFSLTEIIRLGPTKLRNKKTAEHAVKILESHGWVIPIPGGTTINYEKRRQAWQLYDHEE